MRTHCDTKGLVGNPSTTGNTEMLVQSFFF